METLRIIEHGNGHTDIEALIYSEWVVVKCILEDTMPKTDKFSLYEERGELLDIANERAINELPFTLAPQLQEMNEQIRLIENITADNQRVYFSSGSEFETLDAIRREGTEHSPIISGGEILYITHPTGNDDIPF